MAGSGSSMAIGPGLTGMTPEEAEALFLAGLPGPAAELGLGTVVAAAQLKVLASLPPELRTRASRLVERFHLDAGDWFQPASPSRTWAPCRTRSGARPGSPIDYERGDGAVRRVLEPLGRRAQGRDLVRRRPGRRPDPDVPRVARRRDVEPTSDRFERPEAFDLAAYWAESAAAFERDVPRVEVVVRVHPDRRRSPAGGRSAGRSSGRPRRCPTTIPMAGLRLRIRLDYPEEAPGVLLGAGPLVDVLSPPEVRAEVADDGPRGGRAIRHG